MVYVQPPSHGNGSTPPFTPLGTYSGLPLRSVCINIKRQSRNANIFTKILIYPGITWSGGESDPPEWIGYVIYATGMLDLDGRTSVCWIDLPIHADHATFGSCNANNVIPLFYLRNQTLSTITRDRNNLHTQPRPKTAGQHRLNSFENTSSS
jgi:hypothetical protein